MWAVVMVLLCSEAARSFYRHVSAENSSTSIFRLSVSFNVSTADVQIVYYCLSKLGKQVIIFVSFTKHRKSPHEYYWTKTKRQNTNHRCRCHCPLQHQ